MIYSCFVKIFSNYFGLRMWKIEMNKANAEKRKPSLLRVLIQIFGAKYMLCGILFAFIEIVLK